MNRANCFAYSLSDGLKGVFHNLMMSLISFSMMVGSLLVVGSLVMIVLNIDSVIESVGDRNEILIYISEEELTNVIETESWVEQAYIENCLGHHRLTDRFFTYSYKDSEECEVGYFRHYSLDDLIKKARDFLQGTEMSEATKTEYGILSIDDD